MTVARGERERRETGQEIQRRSKGNRERERMSKKDRETGRNEWRETEGR